MSQPTQATNAITVEGDYDADHLDYEIIHPERVFRITYLFTDYWLPLLKPALAWLVVALQQACYHGPARQATGRISQRNLGQLCGLSRVSVNQHLPKVEDKAKIRNHPTEETEINLVSWFISEVNKKKGKSGGRGSNQYRVLLNDPLPPRVMSGLSVALVQARDTLLDQGLSLSEMIPKIVGNLLSQEQHVLIASFERLGSDQPFPAKPNAIHQLIFEIFYGQLDHTLPKPQEKLLNKLATELSRHILRPSEVYIGTQYFRREWVPKLGPTLGWFITIIRRHCYENRQKSETRDKFHYETEQLARMMGISSRTLIRHLDEDGLKAIAPFFKEIKVSRQIIEGRIHVKEDPLTPEDELSKLPPDQNSPLSEQELDQLANATELTVERQNLTALDKTLPSPAQNHMTKFNSVGQNLIALGNKGGQNLTAETTDTRQNLTTDSAPVSTNDSLARTQQQHHCGDGDFVPSVTKEEIVNPLPTLAVLKPRPGLLDGPQGTQEVTLPDETLEQPPTINLSTDEVEVYLCHLGVRQPKRRHLADLPWISRPGYLEGWVQWFENQEEFKVGWVIIQIEAGDWPPELTDNEPTDNITSDPGTTAESTVLPCGALPTELVQLPGDIENWQVKWLEVLKQLKLQMAIATFDTWIKDTGVLGHKNGLLVISVKNEFAKDWIENRLIKVIRGAVFYVVGEVLEIEFQVSVNQEI